MTLPVLLRSQSPRLNRAGAHYFADGNSQTAGINGASNSYPGKLATLLGVSVANYGVGGQTITDMLTDAATQVDANFASGLNILCVGEVRNELVNAGSGANAREAVDKLWAYCDGRRTAAAAASKQLRIVVWNILPTARTSSPLGVAGVSAKFNEANTIIENEWHAHADRYVNVRSDSRLLDPNDSLYYDDQVHLTLSGDDVLSRMMYAAICSLR